MKPIKPILLAAVLVAILLPLGGVLAETGAKQALDCATLYQLASQLEPATQRQQSIVFNDKSRTIAAAIGTVNNAGFALFGVDLAWGYYEDYRRLSHSRRLELVRRQMAQLYCFQKF